MPNTITLENEKPGTPRSVWDAPSSNQIEGFASQFSVDNGETISFKVNVNVPVGATAPFRMEVYRLGYYGGDGATLVTTLNNLTGVHQPDPLTDSRGLVDAGNWSVSASWATPADAVSGVYLAKLVRTDNGATNQIPFIVRDDDRASDVVLQTSDTTWQAYNGWAGRNGQVGGSLYGGFDQPDNLAPDQAPGDQDRAFAVSYNRPLITRDGGGTYAGAQDYLFGADYAAINWLEKNGYDVTYISGVDTDRLGAAALTDHKAYISVGHDEYWSADQRANVEAARDAGVNLLFWSGNEIYWKTRWEGSIADGTSYRTLVSYKETKFNYTETAGPADYPNVDLSNEWTGTWRDTRFIDAVGGDGVTHTAVGAKPENALTGQLFVADGTGEFGGALDIPAAFAGLRVWRDTGVGANGAQDIAPGILGYEWDISPDDAFRPPGLIQLSETTIPWSQILTDQGNRTEPGLATHNLSLYRAPSGALVFGSGTVFWSWGLSNEHDSSPYAANIATKSLQQFTVNMFADMGIQPGVLDAVLQSENLVRATASNDHVAATAILDDLPASVSAFSTVTIRGSAADIDNNPADDDGRVAIVEVSVDGGQTWRLAQGVSNWSFDWTPTTQGAHTILVRAIDDSLNVLPNAQLAADVVTVTAPQPPSTVSLFGPTVTPTGTVFDDGQGVELGMKFSASAPGSVTALRYFRAGSDAGDTDVRTGHLWAADGTLLATATFNSGPGQSGWQVATLSSPVSLQPGLNYVVSYHTDDNYLAASNYFTTAVTDPFGLLRAASSAEAFGNGVYAYGAAARFPTDSFQASNYWADVVFTPASVTNSPPVFTSPASFSTPENSTLVTVVTASDADHDPLTYAVAGGADAALFSINSLTGELCFKTPPDFEAPRDSGADNSYGVIVSVSDAIAAPVLQALTVTVTNLAELPAPPATFAGRLITAEYIFGPTPDTLFPGAGARQTATVDATPGAVEFANLPAPDPAAVGNGQFGLAAVDLADLTVTVDFPLDPAVFQQAFVPFLSASQAPFNGVRLTDADGQLATIRGVSIVSQRGFTDGSGTPTPLTASDFTVTQDGIFLNMAGKGRLVDADAGAAGAQPAEVVLSVDLNDTPVADGETLTTAQNTPVQVAAATLLDGDTDADADTLTVTGVNGASHGVVGFDSVTGVVTFTPVTGFSGQAGFDYVVKDGFGGTATGHVTVNVGSQQNSPPTVTAIDAGTTNEDATPLAINLLAGAADPDNDPLSIQDLTVASSNLARTVQFSLSAQGVLTLNPSQFNNMAAGATETITASFKVSDGVNLTSNTAVVSMEGRNDAPIAADDAFATGEAAVLNGNVISNSGGTDSDPEGTPLAVTAVNGVAAAVGTAVTLTSGARLTLNATGAFTYDPNGAFDSLGAGQQATDSFAYTVSDGALSATATTRITIDGAGTTGLVLTGNNSANTLNGGAGDDSLSGRGGADLLSGSGGRDTLDGGAGADTVNGGSGDDVIVIRANEATADVLNGGDGIDTARIAGDAAVTLTGFGGFTGIELLDGAGQAVRGTGAANVLDLSVFTTVTGLASISGLGGADTVTGSDGADVMDGGSGADRLDGRLGDDVIVIRAAEAQNDTILGGGGTDTLRVEEAGGTVTLAGTGRISGVEVFDGAGQAVRGTSGADVLDFSIFTSMSDVASIAGLGGNDTVIGGVGGDLLTGDSGADRLDGGAGADTLVGGSGADTLTGGVGDDVFRYGVFKESSSSNRDIILDFDGAGVAGGDLIDVSQLSPSEFVLRGAAGFSGGGVPSIRYVISGGVTDLMFDDGSGGSAEMIVRINAAATFAAGDFIL